MAGQWQWCAAHGQWVRTGEDAVREETGRHAHCTLERRQRGLIRGR